MDFGTGFGNLHYSRVISFSERLTLLMGHKQRLLIITINKIVTSASQGHYLLLNKGAKRGQLFFHFRIHLAEFPNRIKYFKREN